MANAEVQATRGMEVGLEREGKFLTFALGLEEYGLEILKVREIIGHMEITAVPQTPEHIKGVINLRGHVIPVLDLRLKFGMPPADVTEETCIIVIEVERDGRSLQTGIVVDRVSEVLDISAEQIEGPPQLGGGTDTQFLLGMAKVEGNVKMLLDIDRVLAGEDLANVGGQ